MPESRQGNKSESEVNVYANTSASAADDANGDN